MSLLRNTRRWCLLMALALAIVLLGSASALAWIPNGPEPTTGPPTAGIMSYDDIVKALNQIEKSSKGAVDVFTLTEFLQGYEETTSEKGRELYVAKVGSGPTRVWVSANIHGVEQLTSEACIEVLRRLAAGGSPEVKALLAELTIYVMPCLSPDDRIANTYTHLLYDDVTGVLIPTPQPLNLNRDWYVGESQRPLPPNTPPDAPKMTGMLADETKAWYAFFCKIQPHYLLDLHHMGVGPVYDTNFTCSLELGISLSPDCETIPHDPDPRAIYAGRTYRDMVRQLQGYIYDDLSEYGYSHIQRYFAFPKTVDPVTNLPTSVFELNYKGGMSSAVMLGRRWMNYMSWNNADWSCPAIFLETKGNALSLGQKASGYLTKQNVHGVMAFLTGIATGAAWDVDPLHWNDIPRFPCYGYYTDSGDFQAGDPRVDLPY